MCGVVSYFGSEPDVISRIVTGMSAIIYRAPDSTGIGMFGNMSEPIVMRKCLGSIANMISVLMEKPCFESADTLLNVLGASHGGGLGEVQKRLITYEDLPATTYHSIRNGKQPYVTSHDVSSASPGSNCRIFPGHPGRPFALPEFTIRSRNDFRHLIQKLLLEYNLSSVAIKALLREQMEKNIDNMGINPVCSNGSVRSISRIPLAEIYNAFDYLFQKSFEELRPVKELRQDFSRVHINPHARKILWRVISSMTVKIPEDFDNDGIRHIFKVVDAAILSHFSHNPGLVESLQLILDATVKLGPVKDNSGAYNMSETSRCTSSLQPKEGELNNTFNTFRAGANDWLTLYVAERAANVYGRAAAAAVEWMRLNRIVPAISAAYAKSKGGFSMQSNSPASKRKGWDSNLNRSVLNQPYLDPFTLGNLAQPVIAHGRWALQSSVTVNNAHPFIDEKGMRFIALNGQFSGDVEEEMKNFLADVAGFTFRTGNSGEYMALFWGYYYEALHQEKKRFHEVKQQVELELESYSAGNNTLNYQIFNQLKDKGEGEIDELAFIRAAALFTRKGGQIAAVGISMKSPGTLFAAASNRPLFIVKRADSEEYMIVSDVNAALGLFSQQEILDVSRDYDTLVDQRDKALSELDVTPTWKEDWELLQRSYNHRIEEILSRLKVVMYALEGGDLFAKIETHISNTGELCRRLTITDFQGNMVHDITPDRLNLTPPHVHKDLNSSFFESHMQLVPDLLEGICNAFFDPDNAMNPVQLNRGLLQRRFGSRLMGLKRMVLSGMGTSYHTALCAAPLIRKLLPHIQVICIKPVEVTTMSRQLFPEQDLLILLSWSATTADMVDFAKKLHQTGVLCISVTEKNMGDLALITRKSGGTVYAMSGEEVTIPAVKSTFCMLMTVHLFVLWFKWKLLKEEELHAISSDMRQIPHTLRKVSTSQTLDKEIENLAFLCAAKDSIIFVDDLVTSAIGLEAALKMEEMTWIFKGRSVDYAEIPLVLLQRIKEDNLVIVNATFRERIHEAVAAMEALNRAGIDFVALTWEGREVEQIEQLSDRVIRLPKLPDCFQQYVDLFLYYQFAFYSGRARGRIDDDYPRNRAKSVTTSRSAAPPAFAPKSELFNIRHREALFRETQLKNMDTHEKTVWESMDFLPETLSKFKHIKGIAQALDAEKPMTQLLDFHHGNVTEVAEMLFDRQGHGEICFYPLDTISRGAIQQTITTCSRYYPCFMRCAHKNELPDGLHAQSLIVFVSSGNDAKIPDSWQNKEGCRKIWFGPGQISHEDSEGNNGMIWERYFFSGKFRQVDHCLTYSSLMLFMLDMWSTHEPEDAALILKHFQRSAGMISAILNHRDFARDIGDVTRRNVDYKSLLYLSPSDGSGISFTTNFDEKGSCFAQWQSFGNSAHGALVTVDSDVASKYIELESRERLVKRYGLEKVVVWENKYLQGMSVDDFLKTQPETVQHIINAPFFSEGSWYLPLLRPGYDPSQDNLIILDAGNEFFFDQAIDDLTVLGCRHARMILVSQDYFLNRPEKRALQKFPLSGVILIPSMEGEDRPVPLSDCHLPFANALISVVMSDTMARF